MAAGTACAYRNLVPFLHIRTINAALDARDDGTDYVDMEAAKRAGVHAGGRIALSEIKNGRLSTIIEVRLEQTDGSLVDRFAVSCSVGDLKTL